MGRVGTHWRTEACIYNQSIENIHHAKDLLEETNTRIGEIRARLLCITLNPECIRESEDQRAIYDIVHSEYFGEDGLLDVYADLVSQRCLLNDLIAKLEKGAKVMNSSETYEDDNVYTDWLHYGDFSLFSAVE